MALQLEVIFPSSSIARLANYLGKYRWLAATLIGNWRIPDAWAGYNIKVKLPTIEKRIWRSDLGENKS